MDDFEQLQKLRRLKELQDLQKSTQAPVAEKGYLDKLAEFTPDFLKNIGTAAYKGVAGGAVAAMDALAGSHDITDIGSVVAGKPVREVDTSMPNTRAFQATGYQPKTTNERYLNSGVQAGFGALTNPGSAISSPVRAAVVGVSSGVGSEAGRQVFAGTKFAPAAGVIGGLAGGGLAGIVTSPLKNAKQLAGEAFRDVTPAEMEKAKLLMFQAKMDGVPINLDQALGRQSNVSNVMDALVSRKEGQPLINQLRDQPGQVQQLTQRMTKTLPGSTQEKAAVANSSQEAATDVIKKAQKFRTDATEPLYARSGNVDPTLVQQMQTRLTNLAKDNPDTNKGALYSMLAAKLDDAVKRSAPQPTGLLDAQGNPMMGPASPIRIQDLNATLRSVSTNAKNVNFSSSAGDKEAIGGLQEEIKNIRDALKQVSPEFKKANDLYEQISINKVDPLKKSVIGRVAGIQGDVADKEAVNKLLPILAAGRNPQAKSSEILKFALATKDDPTVFQNAVKTNFTNAVAAAEQQVNGALSPSLAASLEKTLLGDAFKRQGLQDQLRGISLQMGDNSKQLETGFMAALKIISASAKRPGSIGPDTAAFNQIAGQSVIAGGAKMVGLAPGKPIGHAIQRALTGDAYRTLAENLTTADGVAKLQALAKLPIMSTKAQVLVNTLIGTAVSNSSPEVINLTPPDESHLGNPDYR